MSKVSVDKLSFNRGVIGEDLDQCPNCTWDEDRIVAYCAPCDESVDLMIAFLTGKAGEMQRKGGG